MDPGFRQSLKIHLPKSGRGGALAGLLGKCQAQVEGRFWVWRSEVVNLTSKRKDSSPGPEKIPGAKRSRKHSLARPGGEALQLQP